MVFFNYFRHIRKWKRIRESRSSTVKSQSSKTAHPSLDQFLKWKSYRSWSLQSSKRSSQPLIGAIPWFLNQGSCIDLNQRRWSWKFRYNWRTTRRRVQSIRINYQLRRNCIRHSQLTRKIFGALDEYYL